MASQDDRMTILAAVLTGNPGIGAEDALKRVDDVMAAIRREEERQEDELDVVPKCPRCDVLDFRSERIEADLGSLHRPIYGYVLMYCGRCRSAVALGYSGCSQKWFSAACRRWVRRGEVTVLDRTLAKVAVKFHGVDPAKLYIHEGPVNG